MTMSESVVSSAGTLPCDRIQELEVRGKLRAD